MTERLYVLDTHVLIWYFIGSPRLHTVLRDLIDQIRNEGGHLLVPTITLSEALTIAEKRRVDLDFPELYRLVREEPEFERRLERSNDCNDIFPGSGLGT